ncbi:hypothetical protein TRVA0_037S00386 [Trichomonascus vanleenenianus]|uniref:uncharacterized protein n=1 Tax=Trichomonascus vanleenenianus TaxID=2268995 RepID=UPI003EC9BD7A
MARRLTSHGFWINCLIVLVLGLLCSSNSNNPLGVQANNEINICSSQNTGASGKVHVDTFQSIGLCSGTCNGYAYAILQGKSCWCSNYTPSESTSNGKCSSGCPGYQQDSCGNTNDDLYSYILLATPSGTASASSSSTSSTSSTSSKTSSSSTSSATSSASSSSSLSSSSSSSSSSSASSSSSSNTPKVSVLTITGAAQTRTVTHSGATGSPGSETNQAEPNTTTGSGTSIGLRPDNKTASDSGGSFFDDKGKVAGVFTVVGIVAAGIIAAIVFFVFKHNRGLQHYHPEEGFEGSSPGTLNGDSKGFLNGNSYGSSQLKRDQSAATTLAGLGFDEKARIDSTIVPITVDQRLDPGQMFMQWDHNDSRRSLQDEHDYSRKLRVTNPDSRLYNDDDDD